MKKPLNKDKLIGLTISEGENALKNYEKSEFYQFYICILQIKNVSTFKANKRYHEHNAKGKRIYHTQENTYFIFAEDKELEKESFIIDVITEKGQHDNWSFNGLESTNYHNVYYLIIDHLQKGNKGNKYLYKTIRNDVEYKDGELSKRDRRFTL